MAILESNRVERSMEAKTPDTAELNLAEKSAKGLHFQRYYTQEGVDPYSTVEWELRDAVISGEKGDVVFEQKGVEFPKTWSQMATKVVVSKYFRGTLGTPEREYSLRQLISRVVNTMTAWGERQHYFATPSDGEAFRDELTYLMLFQHASFNSPVWFNCGVEEHPQCSACFINSVSDTMESILGLAKTEGMLFKYGSGTGTNLSPIRSSKENLAGGGTASGPVSFMKGYDAFAGVIKSGGKTRRAAKMVILNVDHPDVVDFIQSKAHEEKKAWALIDAGYDGNFNGEAYNSIFFQNANHSVRVTDDFMRAVESDSEWSTRYVTSGQKCETFKARDLMRRISESAHLCGDPGLQFNTTINKWHTCPNTAPITASNPCSEYMFLDDSACNLASLNLMKYLREDGTFDTDAFIHSVDVTITAQEIIVDNASYPTPRIEANSHKFRPLGLGYANLGALLMASGVPYDGDEGRSYAASITALMCGEAYYQSARVAQVKGAFEGYAVNREPMLNVIGMHRDASYRIDANTATTHVREAATQSWDRALNLGREYGYRNSQVTVLAPTGTIGFMMDCDTTGVEPDIALVKYKNLVGGGILKYINNTVPRSLRKLDYSEGQIQEILAYIDANDTIEGAPHLQDEHLPVFDCAFRAAKGQRSIQYMGHLRMMGAVQPFLSGAISKTVNMPCDVTAQEIEKAYIESWKLGLKAVAIYRDGCKRVQPLNAGRKEAKEEITIEPKPYRRRLPDERQAITHKFSIAGHEGYITVGLYPDGKPGEIFLTMSKEGSVVSGLMDAFATAISLTLQFGVPLPVLANKFSHTRFEPAGFTNNPEIPIAKSITDYIFRWLASKFLSQEEKDAIGIINRSKKPAVNDADHEELEAKSMTTAVVGPKLPDTPKPFLFETQTDAPPCHECGAIMVRSGACYKCLNCGTTSGCS